MLAAAIGLGAATPASAQPVSPQAVRAALIEEGGNGDVRAFYGARDYRPLWVRNGAIRPEAARLVALVESARLDGLKPGSYGLRGLRSALEDARGGDPRALAEAELALTETYVDYARDLARVPKAKGIITDRALIRDMPEESALLSRLGAAPSLGAYLDQTGWMHPIYGPMRNALAAADPGSKQAALLRLNLTRARALPPAGDGRHVVVDAAGARLLMYDNGKLAGSMKVVVGRQDNPTPMMNGIIRYAVLNPYWNVPEDLVKDRVAPHVVAQGLPWLKAKRYQVLSDWSVEAGVTDPKLVDWKAVAAGARTIRVRQLPGPDNGMGRMKFMFPNDLGIYLHDTPDKGLFADSDRLASAGCVRVEDATRLSRWLFGRAIAPKPGSVEQRVDLPQPVPVYITYFTAFPEGQRVVIRDDHYGRDTGRGRKGRADGAD
jgi:murein L,D-transpeptidase YcbB/YkuD